MEEPDDMQLSFTTNRIEPSKGPKLRIKTLVEGVLKDVISIGKTSQKSKKQFSLMPHTDGNANCFKIDTTPLSPIEKKVFLEWRTFYHHPHTGVLPTSSCNRATCVTKSDVGSQVELWKKNEDLYIRFYCCSPQCYAQSKIYVSLHIYSGSGVSLNSPRIVIPFKKFEGEVKNKRKKPLPTSEENKRYKTSSEEVFPDQNFLGDEIDNMYLKSLLSTERNKNRLLEKQVETMETQQIMLKTSLLQVYFGNNSILQGDPIMSAEQFIDSIKQQYEGNLRIPLILKVLEPFTDNLRYIHISPELLYLYGQDLRLEDMLYKTVLDLPLAVSSGKKQNFIDTDNKALKTVGQPVFEKVPDDDREIWCLKMFIHPVLVSFVIDGHFDMKHLSILRTLNGQFLFNGTPEAVWPIGLQPPAF